MAASLGYTNILAIVFLWLVGSTIGCLGEQNTVQPETGFLSANQYTNAFFGFSLPIPTDPTFEETAGSGKGRILLLLQAATISFNYKPRLSVLMISADEVADSSSETVRKAASGKGPPPTRIEIAGREFWRTEWEDKDESGTVHCVKYVTAAKSYAITFSIVAFDRKVAGRLEHSIERISFFDPSRAKEIAGASSKPIAPIPHSTAPAHIGQLSQGNVTGNTYRHYCPVKLYGAGCK